MDMNIDLTATRGSEDQDATAAAIVALHASLPSSPPPSHRFAAPGKVKGGGLTGKPQLEKHVYDHTAIFATRRRYELAKVGREEDRGVRQSGEPS